MNTLLKSLTNVENKKSVTLKGAKSNKSSKSALLDFFAQGGALRKADESTVESIFSKAFGEDPLLALKTLFYFRDVRGGQGERKTFRTLLRWLANRHPEFVEANVVNIPIFGRWDDLFALVGTSVEVQTLQFVKNQLLADLVNAAANIKDGKSRPISLLAKWMPSENTSSVATKSLAKKLRLSFEVSSKVYRKNLSFLREQIRVLERTLCQGDWNAINFAGVPSRAQFKYRKAFAKNVPEKYASYMEAVKSGKEKINTGNLYPYDLVRAAMSGDTAQSLDVMWDNLPDYFKGEPHNGIVVADVSGSMGGLPIQVSISLAMYMADKCDGPFGGHFITFSTEPELVKVQGKSFVDKVHNLSRAKWLMSTDLQKVFGLILDTAVKDNIPESEMPSTLYIVSDMQFDQCCRSNKRTNFQQIQKNYAKAGYNMPRLVFWNVNATNRDSPITTDDNGTVLVSGCSPVIFEHVLQNEALNAYDLFLEVVNKPRYDTITIPV